MKRLILILAVLGLGVWTVGAQPTPTVPASQAEVNAGTIHTKFVAPDTLKAWVPSGGGLITTNSTAIRTVTVGGNIWGGSASSMTNITPDHVGQMLFNTDGGQLFYATNTSKGGWYFVCVEPTLASPGAFGDPTHMATYPSSASEGWMFIVNGNASNQISSAAANSDNVIGVKNANSFHYGAIDFYSVITTNADASPNFEANHLALGVGNTNSNPPYTSSDSTGTSRENGFIEAGSGAGLGLSVSRTGSSFTDSRGKSSSVYWSMYIDPVSFNTYFGNAVAGDQRGKTNYALAVLASVGIAGGIQVQGSVSATNYAYPAGVSTVWISVPDSAHLKLGGQTAGTAGGIIDMTSYVNLPNLTDDGTTWSIGPTGNGAWATHIGSVWNFRQTVTLSSGTSLIVTNGNITIQAGQFNGNGAGLTNGFQNTFTATNFLLATDFTNTSTRSIEVVVNARCNPTTTLHAMFSLLIDPTGSGTYSITNKGGCEADVIFTTAPHIWSQARGIVPPLGKYRVVDVTGDSVFTVTNSFFQTLQ